LGARRVVPALCVLGLAIGGMSVLLLESQSQAQADLEARFALRTALAIRSVESYVADLQARERAHAGELLAGSTVTPAQFALVSRAFGFEAAVLLDADGRVLNALPTKPGLIGSRLSNEYAHLHAAVGGRAAASGVVPSAARSVPIVAVAVPFETPSGRRVFSGGVSISQTPLRSFLNSALPFANAHAYLIDAQGNVIVVGGSATDAANVEQAQPVRGKQGSVLVGDTRFRFASGHVAGTPWKLVSMAPSDALFAPLSGPKRWIPWIVLLAFGLASALGMGLLARVVLQRSDLRAARDRADDASRTKSAFLATMSHEIRTPLNGVIGMTELLLDTDLNHNQRDYAQTVRNSSEALLAILNDILDLAKVEARKMELEHVPFSPRTVVDDVVKLLAASTQAKALDDVIAVVDESVPDLVLGDPSRLRQVLLNLVGNAIKFTSSGEIVISVAVDTASTDPPALRFTIADTGIGIAADKLDVIFQPFAQADSGTARTFGGSGLGLAISGQLVALLGGDCGVSSEVGVGSTFWFTISAPVPADAQLQEQPFVVAPGVVTFGGADELQIAMLDPATDRGASRLLLAEDNLVNQKITVAMLLGAGYHVDTVLNGAAAVEAASSLSYDAVLMDCQMPEMDGYTATATIRSQELPGRRVPIVALTAAASTEDRERCRSAGMDAFLPKPISKGALLDLVARMVSDHVAPRRASPSENTAWLN
jgi:signal transduction histidine kinase